MTSNARSWGDEDDMKPGDEPIIVSSFVKDGIKTVVERSINAEGQKIQTTRKLKVITTTHQVSKQVAIRRKWAKFGAAAGKPPGIEKNVTQFADVVSLDLKAGKNLDDKTEEKTVFDQLKGGSMLVCRYCGEKGTHWTLKCPKRKQGGAASMDLEKPPSEDEPVSATSSAASASKKYVPAHLREGAVLQDSSYQRRDEYSIRITNLSEDTKEDHLRELLKSVGGSFMKIWLAKDKNTNLSRGYAYVNYNTKDDAEKAIAKLNGHGYDNLILRVEWSKPREDKKDDATSGRSTGTPLPPRAAAATTSRGAWGAKKF